MFEYKAEVVRVIDGDTVVLNIDLGFNTIIRDEHVRLYGIDAPESRTRDLAEKEKGLAAKDFLKSILSPGDVVTFRSDRYDSTGKYGRSLGTILKTVGDQVIDVNQLMISEGHAVPYFGSKR